MSRLLNRTGEKTCGTSFAAGRSWNRLCPMEPWTLSLSAASTDHSGPGNVAGSYYAVKSIRMMKVIVARNFVPGSVLERRNLSIRPGPTTGPTYANQLWVNWRKLDSPRSAQSISTTGIQRGTGTPFSALLKLGKFALSSRVQVAVRQNTPG